jgi:hypothetical protein
MEKYLDPRADFAAQNYINDEKGNYYVAASGIGVADGLQQVQV